MSRGPNTIDSSSTDTAVGDLRFGWAQAIFGRTSGSGQARFGVAIVGFVAVLSVFSTDDGPVLCPLRRCSGGYCPACGLTRSGGHLLRGDLTGSWQQHPYLVLAVAQGAAVAALWRFGPQGVRRQLGKAARPLLAANTVVMGSIWIVRMANGSIPIPFFA